MTNRDSSIRSTASASSILSIASAGSILSIGSVGSILSIGSVSSVLSIGSIGSVFSVGSVLSVASFVSILSIGSAFAFFVDFAGGGWGGGEAMTEPDDKFEAFMQRVMQRPLPNNPMARIRTLAKELAEGVS